MKNGKYHTNLIYHHGFKIRTQKHCHTKIYSIWPLGVTYRPQIPTFIFKKFILKFHDLKNLKTCLYMFWYTKIRKMQGKKFLVLSVGDLLFGFFFYGSEFYSVKIMGSLERGICFSSKMLKSFLMDLFWTSKWHTRSVN